MNTASRVSPRVLRKASLLLSSRVLKVEWRQKARTHDGQCTQDHGISRKATDSTTDIRCVQDGSNLKGIGEQTNETWSYRVKTVSHDPNENGREEILRFTPRPLS